jgi:hypothetical protein
MRPLAITSACTYAAAGLDLRSGARRRPSPGSWPAPLRANPAGPPIVPASSRVLSPLSPGVGGRAIGGIGLVALVVLLIGGRVAPARGGGFRASNFGAAAYVSPARVEAEVRNGSLRTFARSRPGARRGGATKVALHVERAITGASAARRCGHSG